MRLLRPALPVLLPVVLLAGACGSDEGGSEDSAALDAVTVDEAEGSAQPGVEVDAPLSVEETQHEVLREGEGEAIDVGDLVSVRFVAVNARSGKDFGATGWDDSAPASFVLGTSVIPGFTTALEGVAEGSRVLTAVAPDDAYGPGGGLPDADIRADDTLVYLIDVVDVGAPRAQGEAVTPPQGLPTVTLDEATGAPTITVPQGVEPPADLVVQPLIKGAGKPVEAGQAITVQYTGALYRDGTVFDSSWPDNAPITTVIGAGQVIEGWDTGLVGQSVGSQVLLVIPPAQGYGEAGQPDAGITGTDTLVFVVDILAAA